MSFKLLAERIEGELLVQEYSKDGETTSHVVKTPISSVHIEPQETLEDKIARIEETNLILMDALATTYEEVITLRMQLGGTST